MFPQLSKIKVLFNSGESVKPPPFCKRTAKKERLQLKLAVNALFRVVLMDYSSRNRPSFFSVKSSKERYVVSPASLWMVVVATR